ncbi:MAG: hypothetical protein KDC73_04620 [Ignavibacteriae bacterium]|nr:hypothetical protein [Ignavibacteriota bacterium]MCB9243995.1 hypothetical protein [Ignavibacteriales bacterium]
MEYQLKALTCAKCGSGLVVEVNDNITYCTSCGSGFEINDGDLQPIEINFAATAIRDNGEIVYKPFWYIKAHIDILERKASGNFFKNLFGGSGENASGDIIFYIPAFYCQLDAMKNIATQFTIKNPVASPQKYNSKLVGFAYGKEDAKKLAEFILISLEAEKSDTMKTFKYNITFNEMEILGVPFYKTADGHYKDAVLGIAV